MSELRNAEHLADETLEGVAGGATRNYLAAVDVMNGKYGNGQARIDALSARGFDARMVQDIVNGMVMN